jgi:hypothetical protein
LRMRSTDHRLHTLQQGLRSHRLSRRTGRTRHASRKRRITLIVSHAAKPPGHAQGSRDPRGQRSIL